MKKKYTLVNEQEVTACKKRALRRKGRLTTLENLNVGDWFRLPGDPFWRILVVLSQVRRTRFGPLLPHVVDLHGLITRERNFSWTVHSVPVVRRVMVSAEVVHPLHRAIEAEQPGTPAEEESFLDHLANATWDVLEDGNLFTDPDEPLGYQTCDECQGRVEWETERHRVCTVCKAEQENDGLTQEEYLETVLRKNLQAMLEIALQEE